jgi:hypothetical protein
MAVGRAHLVDPNCVVTDSDYDAIESAIMESSRGRWFLAEYARRNRHADTQLLLSAIGSIKQTLDSCNRSSRPYLVRTDLSSMYIGNLRGKASPQLRAPTALTNVNNEAHRSDPASCNSIAEPACNANAKATTAPPGFDELNVFEFKYK